MADQPPHPTPRSGRRVPTRPLLAGMAAVAAAIAMTVTWSAQASVPATPAGWELRWSDDFTGAAGTQPSTADWLYDLGTSYPGGAANWGTGEIETMTDSVENVYLDGSGNLAIRPLRDAAGNWTSARIETQRTDFAAPAGGKLRVEGRLRLPDVTGDAAAGYWPAFWMLGDAARPVGATNWPSIGEWDIMENVNGMSSFFATLHCGTVSGGPCNETTGLSSGQQDCTGCQTSFHTFAVEYDRSVSPEQLRWYKDGTNFFSLNATQLDATTWNAATQHGFFVILNVAMGGGFPDAFGGGPTSATEPGHPLLVDYVAVYTSGETASSPTATASPTPTTAPPAGTRDAYATIEAESFDAQSGTTVEPTSDTGGGNDVGYIANGDWLQFTDVDFGSTAATQFSARVASGVDGGASGLVEVRLDSRDNAPIGDFAIGNTGGWQVWRTVPTNTSAITGRHTVYLTFTSGQPQEFVNINWFTFGR